MTNYTLDWGIMYPLGFITKEKPVYLYRIVRSDNKNAPLRSFKEFIVVNAWSSEGNDVLHEGHRYLDYYYNDRLYRKQEVGINEFLPFADSKNFNIWSYIRDDEYAIRECKKWINKITARSKTDINTRAMRLMADRDFSSRLCIIEKDGIYEQEL